MKTIKDYNNKTIKPSVYKEYNKCKEKLNDIINYFEVILNNENED